MKAREARKARIMMAALFGTGVLAGCGGGSSDDDTPRRGALREPAQTVATLSAAEVDARAAQSGLLALAGPARCGVRVVALDYHTIGVDAEEATNASGALLLPVGSDARCGGELPLLAFAKGTDVDKLHTLADPQSSTTGLVGALFAAQGYAVVMSDMLGYARSAYAYHPYLHAPSEASSVIDAIRAGREAARTEGVALSGKVLLSGYSQGGHSAIAAHRAIQTGLSGEFDVVGAAYLSAAVNVLGAVRSPRAMLGYQVFAPMMITSYQQVYGDIYATPEAAFRPPYAATIEGLLPAVDFDAVMAQGLLPADEDPEAVREALIQPDYLAATQTDPAHPLVVAAAANSFLDWTPNVPTLVCYGGDDPMVPPAIHSLPLLAAFERNHVALARFVDVDEQVRQLFGVAGAVPAEPALRAAYYANYHSSYVAPLCAAQARAWFETLR